MHISGGVETFPGLGINAVEKKGSEGGSFGISLGAWDIHFEKRILKARFLDFGPLGHSSLPVLGGIIL